MEMQCVFCVIGNKCLNTIEINFSLKMAKEIKFSLLEHSDHDGSFVSPFSRMNQF